MNSKKTAILSSVFGASLFLAAISVASKGIGFVREMIYAREFGLSEDYNVFLVAVTIPLIINTSIYFLSQNYFIPAVNKFKNENNENESSFFTSALLFFFLIGVGLALLLFLFSSSIIDWYFTTSPESVKEFAGKLFAVYLLTIPLTAAASIASAYLQSKNIFHHPAASQLLLNIVVVLLLIFFAGSYGVIIIPFAFVLATVVQLIYLFLFVRYNMHFAGRKKFSENIKFIFSKTLLFTLVAEILSLSFMFVDRYFLNFVNEGGIAALNYAYMIYLLPISIITMTLSTVLISKFSESYYNEIEEVFNERIKTSMNVSIMIFIPIAAVLFLWGDVIVKILFQRGSFNAHDTEQTFQVLKIFALSIVFYSIYGIINKSLYSVNLLKQLVAITFVALVMKIALNNYFVAKYFESGLAASTIIVYSFMFFSAYYVLAYKLKMAKKSEWVKKSIFYLIAAIISGIIVYVFDTMLDEMNNDVIKVANIVLFMIVYFSAIYFSKSKESELLFSSMNNLIKAGRK
ncbi:MAG: oligosaccharide flippase family protein [Chlorobi bacterium]|nr:oligosaccharide flippase family protein [Chlorobiota bacterium]